MYVGQFGSGGVNGFESGSCRHLCEVLVSGALFLSVVNVLQDEMVGDVVRRVLGIVWDGGEQMRRLCLLKSYFFSGCTV